MYHAVKQLVRIGQGQQLTVICSDVPVVGAIYIKFTLLKATTNAK